jgi:hypothetical protein
MSNMRIIDSEKIISDLFKNLSKNEEIPISFHFRGEKMFAKLRFLDNEEQPFIYSELKGSLDIGEIVEITFFYKETFINFETEITNIKEERYYIANPLSICTSFKRTKTRYKVQKEDNAFISVYGKVNKYPVMDISTGGLSFEADKELFDEGQSIHNIMLVMGNAQPLYIDAVVKYVISLGDGYFRFGLKFSSIEWVGYQRIFSFIFEKSYPDLDFMREFSAEDVASLYDKSRYIRLKNCGNGKNVMEKILKLEKLKNKPMISINMVQQKEGDINAIASAVRIFNQSFYIQQLVSLPDDDIESIQQTDLYSGIVDGLLGHPYFETLIMYIKNDVEWFLEMMRIMQDIISDEDKVVFEPFEVYECRTDQEYTKSKFGVCISENIKDFLVYANENLKPLEIQNYCYKEENFFLNDLQDVFQSLGYSLSRKLFEIRNKDELVGYAVAEAFSEDVDIDGFMNNVRLYHINKEIEIVDYIEDILSEVSLFYEKFGIKKFFLISKEQINSEKIEPKESAHRLIMNRDGAVEFLYFIKANII